MFSGLGSLCSWCVMSPQTISITEEWELLAHEVKVDIDPTRRAGTFRILLYVAYLGI